eukprot:jgi/Bigna1/84170/fgenesh1_pg.125_\
MDFPVSTSSSPDEPDKLLGIFGSKTISSQMNKKQHLSRSRVGTLSNAGNKIMKQRGGGSRGIWEARVSKTQTSQPQPLPGASKTQISPLHTAVKLLKVDIPPNYLPNANNSVELTSGATSPKLSPLPPSSSHHHHRRVHSDEDYSKNKFSKSMPALNRSSSPLSFVSSSYNNENKISKSFVERVREQRMQKILKAEKHYFKGGGQDLPDAQNFTFSTYTDDSEPKVLRPIGSPAAAAVRVRQRRNGQHHGHNTDSGVVPALSHHGKQPTRRLFASALIQYNVNDAYPWSEWRNRKWKSGKCGPFDPKLSPSRILRNVRTAMKAKRARNRISESMQDIRQTNGIQEWFQKRGKRFPMHVPEDVERSMKEIFCMIDEDGNDNIEIDELQHALAKLCIETKADDVQRHLSKIDSSFKNSKSFDFQMFMTALHRGDEWDALLATKKEHQQECAKIAKRLQGDLERAAFRVSLANMNHARQAATSHDSKKTIGSIYQQVIARRRAEKAKIVAKQVPLGGIPFHLWVPAFYRKKQISSVISHGPQFLEDKVKKMLVTPQGGRPWESPGERMFEGFYLKDSPEEEEKEEEDSAANFTRSPGTVANLRKVGTRSTLSTKPILKRYPGKNRFDRFNETKNKPKKMTFKNTFSARVRRNLKKATFSNLPRAELQAQWRITQDRVAGVHLVSSSNSGDINHNNKSNKDDDVGPSTTSTSRNTNRSSSKAATAPHKNRKYGRQSSSSSSSSSSTGLDHQISASSRDGKHRLEPTVKAAAGSGIASNSSPSATADRLHSASTTEASSSSGPEIRE